MIEAAKCMFHKLLGEVRDDLDRVTSQSQGVPMPRSSRTNNDVRVPRYWKRILVLTEEQSGKSVHQTSTETALPQSSAGIPEQVVEGDPRKQL